MVDLLIHTVCFALFPAMCIYLYWDLSELKQCRPAKISKELTFELARECDVKFEQTGTVLKTFIKNEEDLKKEIEVLKKELADIVKDFRGDIEDHKKEIKLLKEDNHRNSFFIEKYKLHLTDDVHEAVKELLGRI